ncbi:hypothetical protein FK531_18575 [Rhodococcus spelaei]|uniref:Uncharacterized protein n=1 Tax=Rhodococcus spelaei TaxID=2546320 RepID=A0A541B0P6_9NOCA|nr:hypothetical protein [Rhodococcus spelaei]TQF65895.1 hypothetical protein FK531_18575 [Rhodococcus spelaei]
MGEQLELEVAAVLVAAAELADSARALDVAARDIESHAPAAGHGYGALAASLRAWSRSVAQDSEHLVSTARAYERREAAHASALGELRP